MLVIGLTGGIGSGKSTVARCFEEFGVPVIDADAIARELVEPDGPALHEIVQTFGSGVLDDDGYLDRARLRRLVFTDPARRRRLESILHPRIREEMRARMGTLETPYCVLTIPLLLETGQTDMVDRVLVVDAAESVRRARIRRRDGLDDEEIEAILRTQASGEQRLQAADDVIVNEGDLHALRTEVERLHHTYLKQSAPDPAS